MAIYNGTQKINMSGVDKVYVGTQLVYQKQAPVLEELFFHNSSIDLKLNPTTKAFEPYTFTYQGSSSPDNLIGWWKDNDIIYYDWSGTHLWLDGTIWKNKTWSNTANRWGRGIYVLPDKLDRYYMNDGTGATTSGQYLILNATNPTWTNVSTASLRGGAIFYDCIENKLYYSESAGAKVYNGSNPTNWSTWTNPLGSVAGTNYWSIPGRNEMFYSLASTQKKKTTSNTWVNATWTGLPQSDYLSTSKIFYYNNNIYYISGSVGSYVLYKLDNKLTGYNWSISNDIDLSYFNTNNITLTTDYLWSPDTIKPSVKANASSLRLLEE